MPCELPNSEGWAVAVEGYYRSDSRTYGELDYGDEVYGAEAGTGVLQWTELTAAAISAQVTRGSSLGEIQPPVDRLLLEFYDPDAALFDYGTPAEQFGPVAGTALRVRLVEPDGVTAHTLATCIIERVEAEHRRGERVVLVEAYGTFSQFSTDVVGFTAPEESVEERISRLAVEAPLTYNPTDQPDYVAAPRHPLVGAVDLKAIQDPADVNALDEIRAACTSIGATIHERRDGSTQIRDWPAPYDAGEALIIQDCLSFGDAAAVAIGYTMDLETCLNSVSIEDSQASTAAPSNEPVPPTSTPPPSISGTVTLPDYSVRPYHAAARTNYTVVSANTTTKLNLSTTTGIDSDGMVSTSNDEITVPVSGLYILLAQVQNATVSHNRVVVNLRVNGVTVAKDDYQTATATTIWRGATVATFRYLYAGDKVSVWFFASTSINVPSGAGYLGVSQVQPTRNTPGQRTVPLNIAVIPSAASGTATPRATDYLSQTLKDQASIEEYGLQAANMDAPYRSTMINTLGNGSIASAFAQRVLDRFGSNVHRPAYLDLDARTDPRWLAVASELDHGSSLLVQRLGIQGRPLEHRCVWAGHDLSISSVTGLTGRVFLQTIEQSL